MPVATDWRTTDEDELRKRQARAREESFGVENRDPAQLIFSNFDVQSGSGVTYSVEIRDVRSRQFSCTCTDFRINGLDTCKHIEAILLYLRRKHRADFKGAEKASSPRIDLVPDRDAGPPAVAVERGLDELPQKLKKFFTKTGRQRAGTDSTEIVQKFRAVDEPKLRVSQEIEPWLQAALEAEEKVLLRREYEAGVQTGRHPKEVTRHPLFPYQREGMLHLAFRERAMLADEMGLGKTIQAIAACALLHHLDKARRVLIVAPASLKAEWEEQIERFTHLPLRLIYGRRDERSRAYMQPDPPFFTITNYEQILRDALDINEYLKPDIVVLDEAQRIKNWSTKTARAIKRLESRYAFVLTGTPLENRIDELYSLVDYLDPTVLGPLFRFNREYYEFDDKGRPAGYRNLQNLRERVKPLILRRRKTDVETELPDRTDKNLFVPLTGNMRDQYGECERQVAELVAISKRRPLTAKQQDQLMLLLSMMRIMCDSPGIIKENPCHDCPKLEELRKILEECLDDPEVKVIVFSEWEGMLRRVRELADKLGVDFAWHTGTVPQKKRRAEIREFWENPDCRLFLSTDSGGVGLNLQNASVVINCDLPWNPAKLEQRIARAWRKNQRRAVTVINLIAENTIEHTMLESLANKQQLADGVLDGAEGLEEVKLRGGRQSLAKRLEQLISARQPDGKEKKPQPADPTRQFVDLARKKLGDALVHCEEIWLKERDTPIIISVLGGDTPPSEAALRELVAEVNWPKSHQPDLQVLTSAAWENMKQLAELGMITIHTRARRNLLAEKEATAETPVFTAEQLEEIRQQKALLDKKLRAAKLLLGAELAEEAVPSLRQALLAGARILSIQNHWPAPEDLDDLQKMPLKGQFPAEVQQAILELGQDSEESADYIARVVAWLEKI